MRCCALTIRDAAMSSIARVIFLVDCTERILRRYSRTLAPTVSALLLLGRLAVRGDLLLVDLALVHRLGGLVERLRARGLEGLLEVLDRVGELLDGLLRQLAAGDDAVVDARV